MTTMGRCLLVCSILLMGIISGVFYAGSTVLVGFDALPKSDAIRAMQMINAHFRNWMFATGFFGSLAVPAVAIVYFSARRLWPVAGWTLAGFLTYLIGAFAITLILSLPLNESLLVLDPSRSNFTTVTEAYFDSWRFWNWVRVFASVLALGFLAMAFREEGRQTE